MILSGKSINFWVTALPKGLAHLLPTNVMLKFCAKLTVLRLPEIMASVVHALG